MAPPSEILHSYSLVRGMNDPRTNISYMEARLLYLNIQYLISLIINVIIQWWLLLLKPAFSIISSFLLQVQHQPNCGDTQTTHWCSLHVDLPGEASNFSYRATHLARYLKFWIPNTCSGKSRRWTEAQGLGSHRMEGIGERERLRGQGDP